MGFNFLVIEIQLFCIIDVHSMLNNMERLRHSSIISYIEDDKTYKRSILLLLGIFIH